MSQKGLANAILIAQREAFKSAAPQFRISSFGTLGYLLAQGTPNMISNSIDNKTGTIRNAVIRYRKRMPKGKSVTADNCSLQVADAFFEQPIPTILKRYLGVWCDVPFCKTLEEDSLKTVLSGTPSTSVMTDAMDLIMNCINGLLQDINDDCLAAIVQGKNAVTGSNAARTVNFPLNGANNDMDSGITRLTNDAMMNELNVRNMSWIGSGFINAYHIQHGSMGANQSGLNTSNLALPKMYFDPSAIGVLGANKFFQVGMDAIQFVNVSYNRVALMGDHGNSWFMTMKFPVVDAQGLTLRELEFDIQLKDEDCPADARDIGGVATATGRGTSIIVSCHYVPVQIPGTAYDATDRMTGVNDVFLYTGTNA